MQSEDICQLIHNYISLKTNKPKTANQELSHTHNVTPPHPPSHMQPVHTFGEKKSFGPSNATANIPQINFQDEIPTLNVYSQKLVLKTH